jgi:hypothetical protein
MYCVHCVSATWCIVTVYTMYVLCARRMYCAFYFNCGCAAPVLAICPVFLISLLRTECVPLCVLRAACCMLCVLRVLCALCVFYCVLDLPSLSGMLCELCVFCLMCALYDCVLCTVCALQCMYFA